MRRLGSLRTSKSAKIITLVIVLLVLLLLVSRCNRTVDNNQDTENTNDSTQVVDVNPTTQKETVTRVLNNTLLQEYQNAINGASSQTIDSIKVYIKKLDDQGTVYTSTTENNGLLLIKISRYSNKNQLLSSRRFALPLAQVN